MTILRQSAQAEGGLNLGARGRRFTAEVIRDYAELESFREVWRDLNKASLSSRRIAYEEYHALLSAPENQFQMRLVVLREHGQVVALAPFLLSHERKRYDLGERRLFTLPVRALRLINDSFVGRAESETVRNVFHALRRHDDFDLVLFDLHPPEDAFLQTIRGGLTGSDWRCANGFHKPSRHWFIDLPATFEEYLTGLSGKTRQTFRRKLSKFDKEYGGSVRVVTKPEDVGWFLTGGERISRMTYQWDLGERLCNDETTRRAYLAHAQAGALRCYVLLAGGEPCAFLRGTIRDGVYYYETPGFDPRYEKGSPGTVLLLRAIEDLVANTDCRVFDFGIGGDTVGYKKLFGNRSHEEIPLVVGKRWRFYPMLLLGLQDALNALKRGGNALLGEGPVKRLIKRKLRRR